MIIAKRLKGKAIAAWLGPTGDAARHAVARARQRLGGAAPRLDLYFDLTDPWSYLAAQAAARLVEVYGVALAIHPITPPASDVDPAPAARSKHAVRDAQLLAEHWDLDFPGKREADPGMVRDLGTALIRERPPADQLRCALELTALVWAGDRKGLAAALGRWGTEAHGEVLPRLTTAYAALRQAGHYQGAMFHYAGEWYWGVDRLPLLEEAIAQELGRPAAGVVRPRPEAARGPRSLFDAPARPADAGAPPPPRRALTCELWISFRSPYSYLALEQIDAVLAPYGVPLALRPIAPMVTRGLAVPRGKRLYIARDAARVARRAGIPFGEICDPLGPGIDHCLALAHWASLRGPAALIAFARSALRGIWSEARDVSEYVDLRAIVERAELPWAEAREALGAPEAAKAAQAAAADLAVIGLWGVPAIRAGDFVAWGQDRLPLLADRLRRHALAEAARGA
jgi:2-hydroxychromene-2-carboxylate isomerase